MEICFSQFCHDTALREGLRRYVDSCGQRGESYEFPHCRMPAGCIPTHAILGFFHREDGTYVMYWRPLVAYRGNNPTLAGLFRQCLWQFDSFEAMERRLRAMRAAFPKDDPNSPPPTMPELPAPMRAGRKITENPWPEAYCRLRQALEERVIGQEDAVEAAAFRLYGHMGKTAPQRPLSLLFFGPTGVGKSELGKAIAPALESCGGEKWQFVWTELNTFTQPHSVHRLIGAPPGYVGYEDEPVLAAVGHNLRTVFMFDELDKAHPDVLKVLMSVLDEGRCTANRPDKDGGRELDFRKCIFVFTTNMNLSGEEEQPQIPPYRTKAASPDQLAERLYAQNEQARNAMIQQGVLQEIAGRFGGFMEFFPLRHDAKLQIIARQAMALGAEYGLQITDVSTEAAQALLPWGESVSMRSAICMLDAKLAPLFRHAAETNAPQAYRLKGRGNVLTLSAVKSEED